MQWTLKRKLLSGFLSLNVMMMLIGGIAVYQFMVTGRAIQATTSSTIGEVEVAQQIVDQINKIRYSGNRFLDIGSPDERVDTLKHLDTLTKQLSILAAKDMPSDKVETLGKLQRLLATYRTKFDAVAQRFEDRVMVQMERLREVEEIETALHDFFSRHKDSLDASRPFLFFMTSKLQLNTYFHTFDDQDFHELISGLENVKKMLTTGAERWDAAEAEQWREVIKQVSMFIEAMQQCNADAQSLRKEVKDTLFSLPTQMLEQAQVMSTRSWQTMQGMSTEIAARMQQGEWLVLSALLVAGLIGLTLPLLVNRSITKSLGETVRALRDIAEGEGDLTQRLTVSSQDEIGQVSQWFNMFVEKIQGTVAGIGRSTRALSGASDALTSANHHMATNAEETAAQAKVVAEIAQQVREHVETVTQAAEELQGCVREIAKNTTDSTKIIAQAVQAAEHATSTISKLGESSEEIGQVVKVITSIAEQTNLLALNATIEAARAGEAGKGFAVVANEVKELAKQTAESTEGISRRISTIQQDTSEAVNAISHISTIISQVNNLSMTIAGAVEEQSSTTSEIGQSMGDAYRGCAEIALLVNKKVSAAAQETVERVAEVQQTAEQLATMAVDLRCLVEQFKYGEEHGVELRGAAGLARIASLPPSVRGQEAVF